MSLQTGARLSAYEVLGLIGTGGMGEVYRARDTKLNRDIALKVLPEAFALDADRLARFKREAQVLASLNHPTVRSPEFELRLLVRFQILDKNPMRVRAGVLPDARHLPRDLEPRRASNHTRADAQ
jgi:serine/threonine protein kinase